MKKKQMAPKLMLFASIILFATMKSIGQNPDFLFEQQYPEEWYFAGTHSLEITSAEGETEGYFVAISNLSYIGFTLGSKEAPKDDNATVAKVMKLSPSGELLGELTLDAEGRGIAIYKLFKDQTGSNHFIAMGKINSEDLLYDKPFMVKFDGDLHVVSQKEIELPEEYHAYFSGGRSMMDSQGDIVFCTRLDDYPNFNEYDNLLYLRFSSEGEVLAFGESPVRSNMFLLSQGDLFEYKDGSGDYGQTFVGEPEGSSNSPAYLFRMNRDFSEFETREFPLTISLSQTDYIHFSEYFSDAFATAFPDNSLLISSKAIRSDGWNPMLCDEVIVTMKLDQNDSIVGLSFEPHDNDSARALACCQGMDNIDGGYFFICNGVYDPRYWQGGEIEGRNRIVVTKAEGDGNAVWRRYYEFEDYVFHPCSVMATKDDGCIVVGRCWTEDHAKAEVFAIKFFSDGSLSFPELNAHVRPYLFYPNPAQDQLHLQYSPDVQPTCIELLDLQGRLVRKQCQGLENIELQGLVAGQYLMKVTMEDGRTFTDKVVKE